MDDQLTKPTSPASAASPHDNTSFHVVGLGASAGGLEALEQFFSNMPPDSGLAFVVVQHLSPNFKSLMDELLARKTDIPIMQIESGMSLKPDHIFLLPPKHNVILDGQTLVLKPVDRGIGLNMPIDTFLKSMAKNLANHAIAVILSGTGTDGSRGLMDIHEAGGMVAVQRPDTAGFDGMPRSAIETEIVNVIANADELPEHILHYVRTPGTLSLHNNGPLPPNYEGELANIFRRFRRRYGVDFTFYKMSTVGRRVERRMKLSGTPNLSDYAEKLESNQEEADQLFRDLLVEVTHFFRDPDAFQFLRQSVIPDLVRNASVKDGIRVWVCGCATGEEAYSLAMLLDEAVHRAGTSIPIKVFATDIHQSSLETASTGVYTAAAVSSVPEEFRSQYFHRMGSLYQMSSDLRKMVIFAPHDITNDPPFTRMDLVTCRNVLIYLEPAIQKKVLSLFHFGLRVGGTLFLGPSESLGDLEREFETLERQWRIFRKIRDVRLTQNDPSSMKSALGTVVHPGPSYVATATRSDASYLVPHVYEYLLSRYVPPSILVNEQFELLHTFGDVRSLLVQPEGRATLDVLRLVSGELRIALTAALHRVTQQETPVQLRGIRTKHDGEDVVMGIRVEPYIRGSEQMYLVLFEKVPDIISVEQSDSTPEDFAAEDYTRERIDTLERELEYTRDTLQATVEELETSNEELQSTNEELVASNEELQSTNEELHSVNEELYSVNAEHQHKIDELVHLNSDMDNLIEHTQVGTIFLDRDLGIRKYSRAAQGALPIIPADVGRPISDLAHSFENLDLNTTARQVLDVERDVKRLVENADGDRYLFRCAPYIRSHDVDGVIVMFIPVAGYGWDA